jgi:hypothetical protein
MPEENILDIDLLITSIEERPLLWNKTIDSYSDRNERTKVENVGETYFVK